MDANRSLSTPLCCPLYPHPFFWNMWTFSLERTKIQAGVTHIWHDSVCPSVTFPHLYCNFKFSSELGLARAPYVTFPANLVLRIASPVGPPLTSQLPDRYQAHPAHSGSSASPSHCSSLTLPPQMPGQRQRTWGLKASPQHLTV